MKRINSRSLLKSSGYSPINRLAPVLGLLCMASIGWSQVPNPALVGTIDNGCGIHFSGPYSVFVSGDYAYISNNQQVTIVDVSDPTTPVFKSNVPVQGVVSVSGNYAYVASGVGTGTLQIFDISDRTSPAQKGSLVDGTGGAILKTPTSVYVSGNYAYITSYSSGVAPMSGLEIVDVTNPASPTHVSFYLGSWGTGTISASGNRILVGTEVLDVSNPASPTRLGVLPANDAFPQMSGNYVYALGASQNVSTLEITDVTNPATSVKIASLRLSQDLPSGLFAYNNRVYIIYGPRIYTGAGISVVQLEIVDVTDPAHPVLKETLLASDADSDKFSGSNSIFASGNFAYLVRPTNQMDVLDVSNSSAPAQVGKFSDKNGIHLSSPTSVFVDGSYAFVANWSDGLEIVDVSDPAKPVHKGFTPTNGVFVSKAGNFAYVTYWMNYGDHGLAIIDVTNPALPVPAGNLIGLSSDVQAYRFLYPGEVYISGNYAYVKAMDYATNDIVLEIVDVTHANNPILVGNLPTGGPVYVTGNNAYIIYYNSLKVVDISDPKAPVLTGSLDDGTGGAMLGNPMLIYVSGSYAYVVNDTSLEIVDVSNAIAPVHKGSLTDGTGGAHFAGAHAISVSGNYAYLSVDGAIEVLDVSNPSLPFYLTTFVNPDGSGIGNPMPLYVYGNYAYTTNYSCSLGIVRLYAIPPPTVTSFTPTSGSSGNSVTITGTNFDASPVNNVVTFNGVEATIIGTPTSTSLRVAVPIGATTGKIEVTTLGQSAVSADDFTCIESITGVDKSAPEFSIYPNPAKESVNIIYPDVQMSGTVEFFNVLGKQVLESRNVAFGLEQNISISELPDGIYLIGIKTKAGAFYKRFVVQK
jgi:hypothetical protein